MLFHACLAEHDGSRPRRLVGLRQKKSETTAKRRLPIGWAALKKAKKREKIGVAVKLLNCPMEDKGIDPFTSRMLSERSTI